jgi:hypothetical protein
MNSTPRKETNSPNSSEMINGPQAELENKFVVKRRVKGIPWAWAQHITAAARSNQSGMCPRRCPQMTRATSAVALTY